MKIAQEEQPKSPVNKKPFFDRLKSWRGKWWLELIVVILVFFAGAFAYRLGILRPVVDQAKDLISGNGSAIKLPAPVQEAVQSVKSEVLKYNDNGLPMLTIDMPFKDYQQIVQKRDEALKVGILITTDADLVNATIRYNDGPKLDAKMRLKGDWTDHIKGDKWSYHIQLKGANSLIMGFNQFSIQSPETRQFIKEWLFHKNLIDEGIAVPRYEFVNVTFNGEYKGVYAIEENFMQQMMEAEAKRPGVIVRFNEDPLWKNRADFWGNSFNAENDLMVTDISSTLVDSYSTGKIAKDPLLTSQAETAIGKLRAFQMGQLKASDVLDVTLWGRFFALDDLWAACHDTFWHNLRFYYNPITDLIEPVAYDAEPVYCGEGAELNAVANTGSVAREFIGNINEIFGDPQIRQAYASELARMSAPGYLESVRRKYDKQIGSLVNAMLPEYNSDELNIPWEPLERRAAKLNLMLKPTEPVRGTYRKLDQASAFGQTVQIDLVNLMIVPLEVVRFQFGDERVAASQLMAASGMLPGRALPTLPPVQNPATDTFTPVRFNVPYDWKAWDDRVSQVAKKKDQDVAATASVVVRLAGIPHDITIPLSEGETPTPLLAHAMPPFPTTEEALQQHEFLYTPDGGATFGVKSGDWNVKGNLILPQGAELIIPAGTTLRFEKDKFLLLTGAFTVNGEEDAPVLLTPQGESWGGTFTMRAAKQSVLRYVTIEKTTGISSLGWGPTSSNTFFESPVTLDHARILNAKTEDGINVINSTFLFQDSEFAYTYADSFDMDFSPGKVIRCSFHDSGGDAIDTQESEIWVEDTTFYNTSDKGISSGEHSVIHAKNLRFEQVRMAIASKDMSVVTGDNLSVKNAYVAGFGAYQKKPQFGPATMELTNVKIEDTVTYAVSQTGSSIKINGNTIESQDFDIPLMYKLGIFGN